MNKVINIEKAAFAYETGKQILSDFSLTIRSGESVGLIGANGTGKSTLMKMLTGLLSHQGKVEVLGLEVEKKNLPEIRKRLGFVFQDSDSQLFMPTVYDDIAFAPRNYGMSREEVEQRVDEALERTRIPHLKYKQNYKMSGGEKRMACIAVVMAMKPEIILLDEPSITLDPYNRRTLINNLNEMSETKLIASHDLDMIYETCERVILMDKTGIRADGSAEEILKDQELLESCHLELPFCFSTPVPRKRK
ncbi:MAG: energy-coupling factor ABC transporter ATP-binding protein [Lachnospiraceae bacterium]|nr:energy-coupling factor ABC transporter ATP-binding protein [Lachnospiraceae bacterium]